MKNLSQKLKLRFLIFVHNSSCYISERLHKTNLFRKLHPSEWSIVKKINNSSLYKKSVNFFKSSCNSIVKFFGFEPIFEIEKRDTFMGKLYNYANKNINNLRNTVENRVQDHHNTRFLISKIELLKLKSIKTIYSSIDSWHKDVSCDINTKRSNCQSDSDFIKVLTPSIKLLETLSKTTEDTLSKLESFKGKNPVLADLYTDEINENIDKISQKNIAIKSEICSLKVECQTHCNQIYNSIMRPGKLYTETCTSRQTF